MQVLILVLHKSQMPFGHPPLVAHDPTLWSELLRLPKCFSVVEKGVCWLRNGETSLLNRPVIIHPFPFQHDDEVPLAFSVDTGLVMSMP